MLLRVAAAAAAAKVVHGCEAAEPENYAGEWVAVAVAPAVYERLSQGTHGQVHVSADDSDGAYVVMYAAQTSYLQH